MERLPNTGNMPSHRESRELFNREWCKDKKVREQHNEQLFTGWRGGVFLREGQQGQKLNTLRNSS